VEFDHVGLEAGGGIDLFEEGIDEQADERAVGLEATDGVLQFGGMGDGVEAALGGDFAAVFGDQANVGGLDLERDFKDAGGVAHFQVERDAEVFAQFGDVAILNVAAIFPEVNRDRIGARQFALPGGAQDQRFGIVGARVRSVARLAQRGHVVDVHAKLQSSGHQRSEKLESGKAGKSICLRRREATQPALSPCPKCSFPAGLRVPGRE